MRKAILEIFTPKENGELSSETLIKIIEELKLKPMSLSSDSGAESEIRIDKLSLGSKPAH